MKSHAFIEGSEDLYKQLQSQSIDTPEETSLIKAKDKMVYIYTSGTTGLPKAAVITNLR